MKEQFTMFWGGPFSQWFKSIFKDEDIIFNCAEQYMMYKKAIFFKDIEISKAILLSSDPEKQKSLGRRVHNFDISEWNKVAKNIVYKGNYLKFTQTDFLKHFLLNTAGTTLVEATPYDRIWGIGLSSDNPLAYDRNTWKGTNWLGEILTKVRDDIQ